MRFRNVTIAVLYSTFLFGQPQTKSPSKFSLLKADGVSIVVRSVNGEYASFNELPKDVKEEFVKFHTEQNEKGSSISKIENVATTFVVTSSADDPDADLTDNVYSPQTLRSAIQNANKLGGSHIIYFSPGLITIQPATALPSVTVGLVIDGTVSAGKLTLDGSLTASGNGLLLGKTSTVTNMIFMSWKNAGLALSSGAVNSTIQMNEFTLNKIGFNTNAAGSTIGGEYIDETNLAYGNTQDGIDLVFANDNIVMGNMCGTKDGITASPNTNSGMYILGERNKVQYNTISGNNDVGLEIGEYSINTLVEANMIGVDSSGRSRLPNMYDGISTFGDKDSIIENVISGNGYGITILGQASGTYIAGNYIGSNVTLDSLFGNRFGGLQVIPSGVVIEENLISCNSGYGISLNANGGALVRGNYIGVNPDGNLDWGNSGSGIYIGSDKNIIGGPSDDDMNIISGNGGSGIEMYGGTTISFPGGSSPNYVQGNLIQKNYIGADITGDLRIPNDNGITMQGNVDSNFVYSNLISGNQHQGVWLKQSPGKPTRNVFSKNYIGTDDDGIYALSNDDRGVYLQAGADNIFGGPTSDYMNLISGNDGQGVLISGPTSGNKFMNNFIGTDLTGSTYLSNIGDGILINQNAFNNVIQWNIISGNYGNGVKVETDAGLTPDGNVIIGNIIGLDISKFNARPNSGNGVMINDALNTRVGGANLDSSNVISGNSQNGVYIYGASSRGNMIRGNYIGTDGPGNNAVPNDRGVLITASKNNIIGGTDGLSGNLISGNAYDGVYLYYADSNKVYANFIGTDISDTRILPNGVNGISIDSSSYNKIGDDFAGTGNIISGNKNAGVSISGTSTGNKVYSNIIGTDETYIKKFGNEADGIQIYWGAHQNWIGKPGAGNVIRFNKHTGVIVADSNKNTISANYFYGNGDIGIDLFSGSYGVTPNDDLDSDVGGNDLQNFPKLFFADGPFPLRVVGSMMSKPNETYTIEIFSTDKPDSTGHGEGNAYIGSQNVGTDSTGFALFNFVFPTSVSSGMFITATATDFDGSTSEFSKCVKVEVSNVVVDVAVTVKANADTLKKGDTLAYLITLQNNGPDSATQVILKDTLSSHLSYIADSTSKGIALFSNRILTVTVGLLEPGEKVQIALVVKVDSNGSVRNKAFASALQTDFNFGNNTGIDTVVIPTPLRVGDGNDIPLTYELQQNYPNPFNPSTTIKYAIPSSGFTTIKIYDVLGKEIVTLVNEMKNAGWYDVKFNASQLSSGMYIYRLKSGSFTASKKLLLMK